MERNEIADLVPDVLCRLPVKSLVRFKNVHKSWQSIMKTPTFINKHMTCFNDAEPEDSIRRTLLVNRTRPATSGHEYRKAFISLLTFDQRGDGANDVNLSLLDLPYDQNEVTKVDVMGPCNGLYCLYSDPICLVNLSLRQVKVVPDSDVSAPLETYSMQSFAGFGYDPQTDDYKVVVVKDLWRGEYDDDDYEQLPWRGEVYSLNTNSWKEVKSPLPEPISIWSESYINSFVNGAFHWYGYDEAGDFGLAFDMVTEVFRKIRLPPVRTSREETTGTVAAFKESLAVIIHPFEGRDSYFDIWVLEDYSNDDSWTKKLKIGPVVGVGRPLGFLGDQFIFENSNQQMVLFDPNTQKIKNLRFHGEMNSLQAMGYMESLVSLRRGDRQNESDTSVLNLVPDPLDI